MSNSHINPSQSVTSLATTTGDELDTPTASTANLLPKDGPYGTSMTTPTSPPKSSPFTATPEPSQIPPPRDYEAAFAALSTSYGFGQGVVAIPPRKPKDKKDGDKKTKGKKGKKDSKGNAPDTSTDPPTSSPSAPAPAPAEGSVKPSTQSMTPSFGGRFRF